MFIARPTERQADGKPNPHRRSEWDCRRHSVAIQRVSYGVFRLCRNSARESIDTVGKDRSGCMMIASACHQDQFDCFIYVIQTSYFVLENAAHLMVTFQLRESLRWFLGASKIVVMSGTFS